MNWPLATDVVMRKSFNEADFDVNYYYTWIEMFLKTWQGTPGRSKRDMKMFTQTPLLHSYYGRRLQV